MTPVIRRGALIALLIALSAPTPAVAERRVVITGGGFGNGIGMSQFGAYGRALNGAAGERIVRHYYTGTEVREFRMPTRVRVGLLQYQTTIEVITSARLNGGGRAVWRVEGRRGSVAEASRGASWRIDILDSGRFRLTKNGNVVRHEGSTALGGPSHPLALYYEPYGTQARVVDKGYVYRHGKLVFGSYSSSSCSSYCMRLVIALDMQEYLLGLSEVPSSWPLQALRAQVIAGRTYALDKVLRLGQHRATCDCAVYDSTFDQVYAGDAKRTSSGEYWERWKRAVRSTDRLTILYDGSPIQAFYSSSSGGHTENNENVWGGTPLPYLRGVPDRADGVSINPNHKWSLTLSWDEFSARINTHYSVGRLRDFQLLPPFGVSGRVTVVKSSSSGGARIVGDADTVRAGGPAVAHALGLKDSLFRVAIVYDVGERFRAKHDALGGGPGSAVSDVYEVPRGWDDPLGKAQNFEVGRMTWRRATDEVVWQWGKVLRRYDAAGRESSVLGMPTSDIWGPGRYLGGSYVNGVIVWSDAHGAFPIRGSFVRVYRRFDGPRGPLGVPRSARGISDTLPAGGRRQRFASGSLFLNPWRGEVYALWGAIERRYRWMGEASGRCGYPVSHQRRRDGVARVRFARGVIRWDGERVVVDCS